MKEHMALRAKTGLVQSHLPPLLGNNLVKNSGEAKASFGEHIFPTLEGLLLKSHRSDWRRSSQCSLLFK